MVMSQRRHNGVVFTHLRQPPKKYTFEMPELLRWTKQLCQPKEVLNLFAGKTILFKKGHPVFKETRVDLNDQMPADYHMDAYDFVFMAKTNGMVFNTVIFDPPYNLRKSREKYLGVYTSQLRKIKTLLPSIVSLGGVIISYGYSTVGMGKLRGFALEHVCNVCHGGDHNDTICIVERKISNMLL